MGSRGPFALRRHGPHRRDPDVGEAHRLRDDPPERGRGTRPPARGAPAHLDPIGALTGGDCDIGPGVLDVRLLNERHGSDFRIAGAYAGGEVGATRFVDARSRRYVFKSQPAGLAPATTEAL